MKYIYMTDTIVDILNNEFFERWPELLNILLIDHSLSTEDNHVNIFWATDNYSDRGKGYRYYDQITSEAISGDNRNIIVPRALKSREQQKIRSRDKAEIFTPSWICNFQNNLCDNAWLGQEGMFNTEIEQPDGTHTWIVNPNPIVFPEGKTWHDYVNSNRLEITCGEAPYLVSRYDAVTGKHIPVERRIGLLDRKLRVINENANTHDEWVEEAKRAYMSTYGFEWQGDNIVIARKSFLLTFIEYYRERFNKDPKLEILQLIAYITSWNIWQMDGLKGVIPNSCKPVPVPTNESLFDIKDGNQTNGIKFVECPGCKNKGYVNHTGSYALVMNWTTGDPVEFVKSIKNRK